MSTIDLQALTCPFPPEQVRQRKGRSGRTLDYLETRSVIARLNEAFGGEWSFVIGSHWREEDEVVVCTTGDGTTSEGEFWEALNTACNLKLPVLFLVEDNGYAISVPVEVQTAGGSISKLVSGFPDLFIQECDGTDVVDSFATCEKAVQYCRERKGPALVHAHTTRPYSHSMSDDERMYRTEEEREAQALRDPLTRTRELLLELGAASEEDLDRLEEEVRQEVADAADEALTRPQPPQVHHRLDLQIGGETIFSR